MCAINTHKIMPGNMVQKGNFPMENSGQFPMENSGQLWSRVQHDLDSFVHHLLSGTQSCGLEA